MLLAPSRETSPPKSKVAPVPTSKLPPSLVTTPLETVTAQRIAARVVAVPVLRAARNVLLPAGAGRASDTFFTSHDNK